MGFTSGHGETGVLHQSVLAETALASEVRPLHVLLCPDQPSWAFDNIADNITRFAGPHRISKLYMGDVIGDLNSRRGQIQGSEPRGNAVVVKAFVPLVNMFGYVSDLRGMSQGRAQYTMQFDHYEQVPNQVADEIQKKFA